MSNDVVVVFVHGINVTCQDYYVPLRDKIWKRMDRSARDSTTFRSVFWADIVRGRQQEYLLSARSAKRFKASKLHNLVIEGLGDAAAYQKTRKPENSAYYEIQARVAKTLRDVRLGLDDSRPLVFIGHSLGCHIVSSYAWDMHKARDAVVEDDATAPERARRSQAQTQSPLERLETLAGLVTMGSNMPLFTFTFGPQHVLPITKAQTDQLKPALPGIKLPKHISQQTRWLNFYSRNDPLGYPLRPLNDAYFEEKLLTDIPTRSEGWLTSLVSRGFVRPLCASRAHSGYWTSSHIAREAASMLTRIVRSDPDPRPKSSDSVEVTAASPPSNGT